MRKAYCVVISKYRLYQAIALYKSLVHNDKDFLFCILCIDTESYNVLCKMRNENIRVFKLDIILDNRLRIIKENRAINEFCWTLKPVFIDYIMNTINVEKIYYVDGDICFFNNLNSIHKELDTCSVLLSSHNYTTRHKDVETLCGRFNSGFLGFRRNITAMEVVRWWKERCLQWCRDSCENGKFGDQKYLESFMSLFSGVKEMTTLGTNIAFWNQSRYKAQVKHENVYVNNVPLIFFHFAGVRIIDENHYIFVTGYKPEFDELIYEPYFTILKNIILELKNKESGYGFFSKIDPTKNYHMYAKK